MALITAPAVADIASAEYVDSVVVKYSTGNTTKAGITKLYTGLGSNNDGTMTQSAINTALSNKQDKLPNGPNDGKKYSLIWNGSSFAFEEFTTGGGSTSIDWAAISEYLDDPYENPNYTFAGYGFGVDPNNYDYANYCEGSVGYDTDKEDQLYFGVDEEGSDACSDDSRFAGMVAGDWYFDIPAPINTKIEGRALCSSTDGPYAQPGDPDGSGSGDTKYCWCKMTSPAASRWVFNDDSSGTAGLCASECAYGCAVSLQNYSDLRSALFESIE